MLSIIIMTMAGRLSGGLPWIICWFLCPQNRKGHTNQISVVFSVELHLCMEGYCWRDSEQKLLLLWKKKNANRTRKKMNEFTENVCQILNWNLNV